MAELIFPLPVKRCRDKDTGRMYEIAGADFNLLFEKIAEELEEADYESDSYILALADGNKDEAEEYRIRTAEEITDTITACVTMLEQLNFNAEARQELYAKINAKNKERGYLDD